MPWREPQSMEEYERRMRFAGDPMRMASGTGMDTASHMPCPWCASPDFMVVKIVTYKRDSAKEHTCKRCGRSGQNINIDWDSGSMTGEFVQTGGPDAPEWLQPHPRRIDR